MSAQDVAIVPEGEESPWPVVGKLTVHLGGGRVDTLAICQSAEGALVFGSGCYAVHDRIVEVLKGVRGATPEVVAEKYNAWKEQILHGIARGTTTSVAKGYAWDYVPVTPLPPTYEEKAKAAAKAEKLVRDAAPEMLAALEALVEWEAMMGGWEAPTWEAARAAIAIAKAKGEAKPKFIPVAMADEVMVVVINERTGEKSVTTWGEWKADLDGGAALVPEDVEGIERDLLDHGEAAFLDQVEGDGVLWRMRAVAGGAR